MFGGYPQVPGSIPGWNFTENSSYLSVPGRLFSTDFQVIFFHDGCMGQTAIVQLMMVQVWF